ncbi:MAG TPA: outer membrane lipoprotein-sorting protein [Rectinemataceae bacterium]|nr:outer membrane lipoprotein-sorting protein [Rectinemataceae bacterium]
MRYLKLSARLLAAAMAATLAAAFAAAQGAVPAAPGGSLAGAPSADALLARLDANESFRSIRYTGRMEITIGGETREKDMTAVAIAGSAGGGSDKALIEFTNPEDRGIRYLKLGKDLWMYFPKEQDTVKISGHLLKEGLMGSDVSYEDALESSDFKAKYSASVIGSDEVDGRKTWILELKAKVPTASYDRRVMWIDAERFVQLKEEMYAKSGMLLKTSTTLAVQRIGDRWYGTSVAMESKLRKNTKTTFTMQKIELDVPLDSKQFTMAALTR